MAMRDEPNGLLVGNSWAEAVVNGVQSTMRSADFEGRPPGLLPPCPDDEEPDSGSD